TPRSSACARLPPSPKLIALLPLGEGGSPRHAARRMRGRRQPQTQRPLIRHRARRRAATPSPPRGEGQQFLLSFLELLARLSYLHPRPPSPNSTPVARPTPRWDFPDASAI